MTARLGGGRSPGWVPSTWWSWAAMLLLALTAAVTIGLTPVPGALAFGALVLVAIVALSPELALGSILLSSLLILGLDSLVTLPSQALLLTRVLVGVFVLSALLQVGRRGRVEAHLPVVMAWAGVLALSALSGASAGVLSLQSLWVYACGPAAYLAILYSDLSIRSLRRVSLIVACILLAELPIVIFQSLFVAQRVDQIGGTFGAVGGTAIMAVVMGFAWTAALAMLTGRSRIWLIPLALGIAAVLLLCEAKAGFGFCALGTIAVGLTKGVRERRFATVSLRYLAVAAGAIAALFGGYVYAGDFVVGGERQAASMLRLLLNPRAMFEYFLSYGPEGQAGRLEGVRLALTQNHPAVADILLGRGPGLLSSSTLLGGASAFLLATGTTFDWATSLTRSILETGILGTVLYVGVVASAVWTVIGSWRPRASELGVSVTAAAVGLATVYVLSGAYTPSWHKDAVAILFWCVLGIAARWGQLAGSRSGSHADDA